MQCPAGPLLPCEELRDSNRQELSSSITVSFLDHKSLREKDLHPPGSAEAPDREETSRSDQMFRGRERSDEFPSVSALHLSAEVGLCVVTLIYCLCLSVAFESPGVHLPHLSSLIILLVCVLLFCV